MTKGFLHSRRGMDLTLIVFMLETFTNILRNRQAFLQAWLYFGLICDVLRVPWKEQAFTSINNAGQKVVTCPQLPQYLLEWKQYLRGLDKRRRWTALQDTAKSLAEANAVISNVARSNPSGVFPLLTSSEQMPLRPEIGLSV